MSGYLSKTLFCAALGLVALSAALLPAAAPVITPDTSGYDAKITREKALLQKAVLPAQIIRAHLSAATERLAELDALTRGKKFDYVPQLVVSYTLHMRRCAKNLELPPEMRTMDGPSGRALVEMVFPHTTTISSIALNVDETHREAIQDALVLAGEVKDLILDAWKNAPKDPASPAAMPLNVRIDVKTTSMAIDDDSFLGLNWQYHNKNVKAGSTGNILARNGIRISVGSVNLGAALGTGIGHTTMDSMTNQFIVVMSGKTAIINIGTTHVEPVPILIFEPGTGNVWLSQTHRLAKAGAYLEVRPTVIPGGLVRVDLTPVLTYYDEEKKLLKLTKLSTTVVVPSGQSMVIGGLNTDENTIGKAFFRVATQRRAVNKVITLTPRIQRPMIMTPGK